MSDGIFHVVEYEAEFHDEPIQGREQVVLPDDDEQEVDGQGALDLGDDYSEEEDDTLGRNLNERIQQEPTNLDVERQRLQS